MPELLTHLAAARLPAVFLRRRWVQALFVFGTFMPDIASKGFQVVTSSHFHFTVPTHSLLGVIVLSYLASLFIEERGRGAAFGALAAGALLHVGVDLLKDNLGSGAAFLLHPFSTASTELGLIHPYELTLLPFDAALLVALWLVERRLRRVRQ